MLWFKDVRGLRVATRHIDIHAYYEYIKPGACITANQLPYGKLSINSNMIYRLTAQGIEKSIAAILCLYRVIIYLLLRANATAGG